MIRPDFFFTPEDARYLTAQALKIILSNIRTTAFDKKRGWEAVVEKQKQDLLTRLKVIIQTAEDLNFLFNASKIEYLRRLVEEERFLEKGAADSILKKLEQFPL